MEKPLMGKLLDWDKRASNTLRIAENPGLLRSSAAVLAHSGDSWFWLSGLALVWLLGDGYWRGWSLTMIGAILVTALIVLTVKFTVRRQRPAGEWGGIYRATDPHSFPSGHAARAALVAVLAIGMGPVWVGWVLLVWAPLVVLARVAMGVHYLSDVLAGAVAGCLIGIVSLQFIGL